MAVISKLSLLAGAAAGVSAYVSAPFGRFGQQPLGFGNSASVAAGSCELPPVLAPSTDGAPSAESLFSSKDALTKQIERHQAIVRVPSICFDDLGEIGKDERWAPFYELHDVLADVYPVV